MSGPSQRWLDYFLQKGDGFDRFWGDYLKSRRDILFIAGLGFDPRTCHAYRAIVEKGGDGKRDFMGIGFVEGEAPPKYANAIKKNRIEFENLIPYDSLMINKRIETLSPDGRGVGSRNASKIVDSIADFAGYNDVVVDISAMPVSTFFPLIGKILSLLDSDSRTRSGTINLHVVVSENATLDSKIRSESIGEDANYMPGFRGLLDLGASGVPRVWIPVLGEGQKQQMERIYEMVQPNEVSPILPMPSVNPRRADDLLLEYRELFLDRKWVEPGNFILASEQNPFNLYRELHRAILHCNNALTALRGCQVAISIHSSKLLSIGALLVSYELKAHDPGVGVVHVDTNRYVMDRGVNGADELNNTQLATMWLAGECYGE